MKNVFEVIMFVSNQGSVNIVITSKMKHKT